MAGKSEDHSKMLSKRLGQAIHNGELEQVRMYIEQGADINRQCYSGKYRKIYPLALACLRGHEEVMEELLKADTDPNQVSGRRSRPAMFMAAEQRVLTLSMMRCLISHGANVNIRGYRGKTILNYLTLGQFNDTHLLPAAKLLLENGASFNARDRFGYTLLYEACSCGNIDLVKLFIAHGAEVNYDIEDKTLLRVAADIRNIEMFDLLLNAGANRHLTPAALSSPCHQNDHAMIEKILDTCDVEINMPRCGYFSGMTILHWACDVRGITSETVRLLLDRGADVRAMSLSGDTALHYTVKLLKQCDCNIIRQLLSYNPPLNIKNKKKQTPLAELSLSLFIHYSQFRHQAPAYSRYYDALYQADVLAFKMLVTAGAKITTDIEHRFNELRLKHPDAQLPDYEIRSTRSLNEMCRFVIRGTIPVPVDVSLCKLPIPKLLQEYLTFSEFDPLVEEYNIYSKIIILGFQY